MPVETRVSKQFAELVRRIMGDDSYGQASVRTEISKAYLLQMASGKVPSEAIIEKFVRGYADRSPDLHALRVAAGYEKPEEALSGYYMIKSDDISFCVREGTALSEEDIKQIADIIKHGSGEAGE